MDDQYDNPLFIDPTYLRYLPVSHQMLMALRRVDLLEIARDDEDDGGSYSRETVLLLQSLSHTKHFPDFSQMVYALFANQDGSPVTVHHEGKIDALAKEIWHVWTRHQEIIDLLLTELTGESTAPEMSSLSDQ